MQGEIMSETAEKEYEELKKAVFDFLAEKKGHCKFEELDTWSRERGLPRLTLRIAINELIDAGELTGSAMFAEIDDLAPWVKIPSEISLRDSQHPAIPHKAKVTQEISKPETATLVKYDETEPTLRRAIEYLNDYPSVGIMRFNLDLQNLQISDTDRVLKRLSEEGFVEVSPLGVVNATAQLPKITRSLTLGDLIRSNS